MSIYFFDNYKKYLRSVLKTSGKTRGSRIQLARALGTQPGFITQVLTGNSHFSLEHAVLINEFLNHGEEESHFFMLLVQYGKSGSARLKNYFLDQIRKIKDEKRKIKSTINVYSDLDEKDFAQYYSNWYYAAIHVLVSIPKYTTKDQVSKKLGLPDNIVSQCLDFLVSKGLVLEGDGQYTISQKRIHLDKSSPLINKHHTNWRLEAIKSCEIFRPTDLHYSSIFSFSKSDQRIIFDLFLKFIAEIESIIKESDEEEIYSINLDLFSY